MNYDELYKQAIVYLDNKKYKKALKILFKLEELKRNSVSFDIGHIYSVF